MSHTEDELFPLNNEWIKLLKRLMDLNAIITTFFAAEVFINGLSLI